LHRAAENVNKQIIIKKQVYKMGQIQIPVNEAMQRAAAHK